MLRFPNDFLGRLTRIPTGGHLYGAPLLLVALIRMGEEAVFHHKGVSVHLILDYYLAYLLLYLSMLFGMRLATGRPLDILGGPMLVGLSVAFLPPLLDVLFFDMTGRGYVYFPSFHWDFAAKYMPVGETIGVWLGVFFAAVFALWLTRNPLRALLAAGFAWLSIQIFGHFWFAGSRMLYDELIGIRGVHIAGPMNVVAVLYCFILYGILHFRRLAPTLRRTVHTLPFGLIAAIGARLAGQDWVYAGLKGALFSFAFLLILVGNDHHDRAQDGLEGGEARKTDADDAIFSLILQACLVFWAMAAYPPGAAPLLFFFLLGVAYHTPPLRFKRVFCLAYKIEGLAATAAFLFGVMGQNHLPEQSWVPVTALLVFGGFAAGSMFKDYKDIAQDRAGGIATAYTQTLARGRSVRKTHYFVSISLSVMLFVPSVWLWGRANAVSAVLLLVLATFPGLALLSIKTPKTAVTAALWMLSLYLAAFLAVAPNLGPP